MLKKISSLAHKQQGATAVEYGLMIGLIAAVLVVTIIALQGNLTTLFDKVSTALAGG